ncbi:MAG: hypothetical protein ACTSWK_08370 [Promethearchaeota archaeon]
MWEIAVGLVANAVWHVIQKLSGWAKDYGTCWKGTIEDLNQHGIYEDKVWIKPIEISGTYSEFIPFVNFAELLPNINIENIPPSIGTCRLGDSVVSGKYIGALYLPDEHSGISTPAVPIFFDNKIQLSRSVLTGDQIKLKCRVLELENIWRRIFSPKGTFEFERRDGEAKPYGLEVLEVITKQSSQTKREFTVDFWVLYDFPQYLEFTEFLGDLGEIKKMIRIVLDALILDGEITRFYGIDKEGGYDEAYGVEKEGHKMKSHKDRLHDFVKNYYLLNKKTGTFMTYNKIDVGELPDFNKYQKGEKDWLIKAPEFIKLHLIRYPFYYYQTPTEKLSFPVMVRYDELLNAFLHSKELSKRDIEALGGKRKITQQIRYLKDLKASFQSDQVNPFIPQKLNIKDILKQQGLID